MKKNWIIRETRDSDAQALIALLFVSWLDTYVNTDIGVTREFIIAKNLPHLEYTWLRDKWDYGTFKNTADNIHFVAVDERGSLLGFLHACRDKETQYLGGLYVCKEMKGSGLAQELAAKFLEWEDRTRPSQLGVVEYNTRAIGFYEKMGFKDNGVRYIHPEKVPCIDMVKKNEETA